MEFMTDEEFQHLTLLSILKHSIAIPKSSPKTFFLITLSFIFPLSLAILVHTYIIHPLVDRSRLDPSTSTKSVYRYYAVISFYEFLYLLFVSGFSLLATSASVFTVASLYTSNSTTFSTTISAGPRIFPCLFVTFLWISLLMFIYNAIFYVLVPTTLITLTATGEFTLYAIGFLVLLSIFFSVHVYVTSVWQVASVVSVLEPIYGLAAVKKSRALLRGKTAYASVLVLGYAFPCGVILVVFSMVVVHGGEHGFELWLRILVGVVLLGLLVGLNLVAMMVQSVFYFVCKSFHQESIDKNVLLDLLGGYGRSHVKLNSMI